MFRTIRIILWLFFLYLILYWWQYSEMHLWPNFIGVARSERNTRSGFKGSRVCDALLIKLVRIRDRRGIKRTVEKAGIEEEETKNNNEGNTSGGSRPHFPIPRQSIITWELRGSRRLPLLRRESGILLGQSFGVEDFVIALCTRGICMYIFHKRPCKTLYFVSKFYRSYQNIINLYILHKNTILFKICSIKI